MHCLIPNLFRHILFFLASGGVVQLLPICSANAAPADMRVVTDEMLSPNEFGLELQFNAAKPTTSIGQGYISQEIIEPAFGIAEHWEASLQLPVEQISGAWYGTGLNTELQYVAPHDDANGYYWGWRGEINFVHAVNTENSWQSELRSILGYRVEGWHLVLNPSITVPLTGSNRRVTFEPSAKVVNIIGQDTDVGFEYFVESGPIAHTLPSQQRYELPMLVMDTRFGKSDFNIGVGKGRTNETDQWVIKAILSL